MKAYFPNLIAKKDINMVSPTSLATRNVVPAQFGNTASQKKPKKFVKMSRSQHGSSAFASVYPADQRHHAMKVLKEKDHRHANTGEIIMPVDFQTNNHIHHHHHHHQMLNNSTPGADLIVIDDYKRSIHHGLTQEGNAPDVCGGMLLQNRVVRRNSFADGMTVDTAGSHAIGERKNTTTLPPIASVPSNSSKAKQLITNVQATPQPSISQYNSN